MPALLDNQDFEGFIEDYYKLGPKAYMRYLEFVQAEETGPMELEEFRKILTEGETNFYENSYSREVFYQGYMMDTLYRLLPKVPITASFDSFKYTSAHNLDTDGIQPGGATAFFGTSTEPSVSEIENIISPIMRVILSRDLHSMIREKLPMAKQGGTDWSWLVNDLAPKAFWDYVDTWLGGYETASNVHGVDTPAADQIECLDRMISDGPESGDSTDHVSAATDGDIFWDGIGSGTAKSDRSETSAAWSEGQITLPDSAGTEQAYEILEEIDDLMAVAKKYSPNKNYIGITTDKTLNLIQDEIAPGARYLERDINVAITLNGVQTRPGVKAGIPVQGIRTCGIDLPVFAVDCLPTKNSVYTTATAGHFYGVDLDTMFIRVDMPVSYLETGFGVEMLHQNYARSRATLFAVQNLVMTKGLSNFALKWIKDS